VTLDPVGLDPHQTISFATMTMLSFTHSRLVKVKAGPSVRPGTYPLEADVAESWTQPTDTTYLFKLRKGVRRHNKPPVNGRELTAEDVKYTYERFLTIKGNGNRATLESLDKIEAIDKSTVKFILKEPNAWLIDLLASTSTWLVAREAVEKFGDLKRAEAVIGTGPWMLERYEPNVKLVFVRNPDYFVPGLPYADGVEVTVDTDPSSRVAGWLAGKYDFGPEYQQVVRRLDLDVARRRKPGLQTAEYLQRAFMPGQSLNSSGVNDPRLTDMINLQRRTFDVTKRREILYDIQRSISQQAYYLYFGSARVVSAWEPYVRNWAPHNGFDYGERLMAAWLDR
jgi:peptide/nickel transport system substrate-binding protein